MNFVMSLDGAVTLEGRSGGLGDESDRAAMQVLRTLADVVLVGAGTVRAEGYGGLRVDDQDAAWRRAHRDVPSSPRWPSVVVAPRPRAGASVLLAGDRGAPSW
jgi:riboflavin biosynthesis pyrimidine reductase